MATVKTIGALELSSIGIGYRALDEMLKAADVEVLLSRTICSGKYFIVLSGSVDDVRAAVRAGLASAEEAVIDSLVLPNVHEGVFPALGQSVVIAPDAEAIGVIESFSGVSIIAAADAAAKAARVTVFRLHVAMALGGKGFCLMAGSVGDCRSAVKAGADEVRKRGLLVSEIVIPRPSKELFSECI